jgi:hypothetical protein
MPRTIHQLIYLDMPTHGTLSPTEFQAELREQLPLETQADAHLVQFVSDFSLPLVRIEFGDIVASSSCFQGAVPLSFEVALCNLLANQQQSSGSSSRHVQYTLETSYTHLALTYHKFVPFPRSISPTTLEVFLPR